MVAREKISKYQTGFTKSSSQSLTKKGTIQPIAAQDVVEPAVFTRNNETTDQFETIVKKWDMVIKMPYPPPFFNDEPLIPSFGAQLKDPRNNDVLDTVGAMDLDSTLAFKRTLGEIIERFCQLYPSNNISKVINNYLNLDQNALDPSILFPFGKIDPDILENEIQWVRANKFQTQQDIYIPTRSVYLQEDSYEPKLDSIRTTNGTAFSTTLEDAIFGGFCEILERDAFFIQYLTGMTPPRIQNLSNKVNELIKYFSRYKLEVNIFDISLEFEPIIIMAIIIDRSGVGPSIGIGTACGLDAERTILKAILEAQQIRLYSRRLKLDIKNKSYQNPLEERALKWYDIDNIEKIDFFLNSNIYTSPTNIQKTKKEVLYDFPHDIYVCDLSQQGMNDYKVIKVLIPECLQLYFDDAHKPINIGRFKKYIGGNEINPIPHPFI